MVLVSLMRGKGCCQCCGSEEDPQLEMMLQTSRFGNGPEETSYCFYAFDLLRLNGKDLQDLPIEERKAKLEELLKKPPGVIRYSVSFTKDIPELLDRAHKLGLEGLIGKRSGSRYEPGRRTGAWIKLKLHQEQEFVIGGYTEPEGSRKFFGALLVGFYEGKKLKFAGRVGTGFSEKLLSILFSKLDKIRVEKCPFYNLQAVGRSRWDQGLTAAERRRCHWVKPTMLCQIKFTEWTRDDRLRQPVFLGIREDKNAIEVVRETATQVGSIRILGPDPGAFRGRHVLPYVARFRPRCILTSHRTYNAIYAPSHGCPSVLFILFQTVILPLRTGYSIWPVGVFFPPTGSTL
jgi:DNA ligase D-like protein (predicted ligase)